jgi:hypothetical protein
VLGYVGQASWTDFTNSAVWAASSQMWEGSNRQVFWSVPLIVNGANLAAAAGGQYNSYYTSVAKSLLSYDHNPAGDIYVRTGWEFNGGWMPWKAAGQPENFKGAFQQFVKSFEAVSPRFKFEWTPNMGKQEIDPVLAYPGDEYVDIIGMDFYWAPEWQGTDPVQAFNAMKNDPRGLQWLEDFAAAHKKPTAYSEWGVHENVNGAEYMKLVNQWFDSHNVVYQTYWDSNAAFPGKISDGSDPDTGAAYKFAFSGPSTDPQPQPDAPPEPPPTDSWTGGPRASYWIIDATTNTKLVEVKAGVVIDHATVAGKDLSLAAFENDARIESVRLDLDGLVKLENGEPYALFGDSAGDYNGGLKLAASTSHSVKADLYSADNAGGTLLASDAFTFSVGAAPVSTTDTITVRVQGDGWNGDPNFRLIVDGKVIDSGNLVWADRRDGEWQTFTFKGEFDPSGTQAHRVGIQFNNDLYGGSPTKDRNLYVDKVTFNGVVNDRDSTFMSNGTKYWDFSL